MPIATPRIRSGRLRHRIEIQKRTDTRNEQGGVIRAWTKVAKRKAAIIPLTGKEFLEAQQTENQVTHQVELRYYDGLDPKEHRFLWDSRALNIQSVLNIEERKRKTVAMCKEDV